MFDLIERSPWNDLLVAVTTSEWTLHKWWASKAGAGGWRNLSHPRRHHCARSI